MINIREDYLLKIKKIPDVSFNKEQKEIAKKIISSAAEKEIKDVKVKIKTLEREERAEENLERKIALQEEIASLERKKRRLRQEIFDVEDEIEDERKTLSDALKQHLNAKISTQHLFTFKWKLC